MREAIRNTFPNGLAWLVFLISDAFILVAAIILGHYMQPHVADLDKIVEMQREMLVEQQQFLGEAREYIEVDTERTTTLLAAITNNRWTASDMELFLDYLRENHPDLFGELPNTNFFKKQYLEKINSTIRSSE